MTEKRFTMNEDGYIWDNKDPISQGTVLNRLNALNDENEELKQEVELLREGLKAYEGNLPAYLDCAEICDFNADLLEFRRKRQKFYNEHPNRCKVFVDGVELK